MNHPRDLDLKRPREVVRYRRGHGTRPYRVWAMRILLIITALTAGLMLSRFVLGKPPDQVPRSHDRLSPTNSLIEHH